MSFLAAVAFLTVLPLPDRWRSSSQQLDRSVRWFPLVGLGIGLVLAGIDAAIGTVLVQPARDAVLVLALVALTGALHLDGLMDTCDGYFATATPERRLEMMRDSHVGSFGVAGAGLLLIGKFAALASLGEVPRWAALVLTGVLGRWAMALAIGLFPAARADGLGCLVKSATRPRDVLVAALLALLSCWLALQLAGLLLAAAVGLVVLVAGRALAGRLTGLTGDTYGALNELAELATLALCPLCLRLLALANGTGATP